MDSLSSSALALESDVAALRTDLAHRAREQASLAAKAAEIEGTLSTVKIVPKINPYLGRVPL